MPASRSGTLSSRASWLKAEMGMTGAAAVWAPAAQSSRTVGHSPLRTQPWKGTPRSEEMAATTPCNTAAAGVAEWAAMAELDRCLEPAAAAVDHEGPVRLKEL